MSSSPAPSPATRQRILDLLKRGGPLSAGDLAASLKLTRMGVRQHLYTLAEENLVASEPDPASSGRGRPNKLWRLTETADRLFPDAHQGLAVELISVMRQSVDEETFQKMIELRGQAHTDRYKERMAGAKTLPARLRALARARTEEGYMADVERDGDGWLLIENHCPICSAARQCTSLCANELEVFQQSLGGDVTVERTDHILAGARRCAYRVVKSKGRGDA